LQVPEGTLGKKVKCPACTTIFVAQADSGASPAGTPRRDAFENKTSPTAPAEPKPGPASFGSTPGRADERAPSAPKPVPVRPARPRYPVDPFADNDEVEEVGPGRADPSAAPPPVPRARTKPPVDPFADEDDEAEQGRQRNFQCAARARPGAAPGEPLDVEEVEAEGEVERPARRRKTSRPQPKSGAGRVIALILGGLFLVVVLGCGGCVALVYFAGRRSVPTSAKSVRPGVSDQGARPAAPR